MFGSGYVDTELDLSDGQWETGLNTPPLPDQHSGGPSHLSFAGLILLIILIKAFTESSIVNFNLSEIRVSLVSIMFIGVTSLAFHIGFKAVTALQESKGLALPGQVSLAAAA